MAELVQAPGLETADGWEFFPDGGAQATRSTIDPYAGSWHGQVQRLADGSVLGGFRNGRAVAQLLPADPGTVVNVALQVKRTGGAGAAIDYDPGDGAFQPLATVTPGSAYSLWEPGGFTVTGPGDPAVQIRALGGTAGFIRWDEMHAATAVVEAIMARMLPELARKAILATLQTYLNPELVHIQNERNDGIVLNPVTSWYGYKRGKAGEVVVSPNRVEIELIVGGVRFSDWKRQIAQRMDGQRANVNSEVGFLLGLNHAGRDSVSAAVMEQRSDRYATAIVRVLSDHPTLGQGQACTLHLAEVRLDARDARAIEGTLKSADRIELMGTVVQQESYAGETTVGGGVAPSAQLEVV